MRKFWTRAVALLLASAMLAGCGGKDRKLNGQAALDAVLSQVKFDTELSEVGSNAVLYFPDLPEGTQIQLYTGSGYFADEAVLLTLPNESDSGKAMKVVENHLKELRNQFMNYVPEEVGKIDAAVTVQNGNQILLVITNDTAKVNELLSGSDSSENTSTTGNEDAASESTTFPVNETLGPLPGATTATTAPEKTQYPQLTSQSGEYHDYGTGVIRVDNKAYEQYTFVESSTQPYVDIINSVAEKLKGDAKVYDIAIPTAVGIILPDDIAKKLPGNSDQNDAINRIFSKMSDDVVKVNPYDNLMKHRDEYLYFHTDYHWNGRGAYYAYEAFCQAKGITPYKLDERKEQKFENFLGVLYNKNSGGDEILKNNPDTVEAFNPHSPNAKMRYTDQKGKTYDWSIIMDVSDWDNSSKYSTFAAGDNPIAVFENPDVTDGSVAVVVKESYGNALLPYLVDHYSTIYEIDYRYWTGSLVDFVREKGASDLIFANNLHMIGSSFLIGKLANVAK